MDIAHTAYGVAACSRLHKFVIFPAEEKLAVSIRRAQYVNGSPYTKGVRPIDTAEYTNMPYV